MGFAMQPHSKPSRSLVDALVAADRWLGAHADELAAWLDAPASRNEPWSSLIEGRRAAALTRLEGGEVRWRRWASQIQEVVDELVGEEDRLRVLSHVIATDFDRARFYDDTDLAGLAFPGDLILDGATFARDLWLIGARVSGNLIARRIKVARSTLLESIQVSGAFDFLAAELKGTCEARQSQILGPASFSGVEFDSDLWLSNSTFFADADFSDCTFAGEAGFGAVVFNSKARFDRARFRSNAGFSNVNFKAAASFVDSDFKGKIWLENAMFAESPNVRGARGAAGFPAEPGANPVRDQIAELKRRMGVS